VIAYLTCFLAGFTVGGICGRHHTGGRIMIVAGLLTAILALLMIIASVLVGLLLRLNGLQQQVERWRQEWVQLRRDDPGRVLGSLHE
jgi:hypothetical protein